MKEFNQSDHRKCRHVQYHSALNESTVPVCGDQCVILLAIDLKTKVFGFVSQEGNH